MTSRTIFQENTATQFNQHRSMKRLAPHLPRLLGSRVSLAPGTGNLRRFKPNLNSSRTRPSLDAVKEDVKTSIEASKNRWINPCFNQDLNSNTAVKESMEIGQAEGSGLGTVEEPDSDDNISLRGSNYKSSHSKLSKTSHSVVTSPETVSVESCEMPTELDLAQDASYEIFSMPLDDNNPAALTKDKWEKLLERLRQEKGFVCTAVSHSTENTYFTFSCQANHSFTARISEELSCPKCESILDKCREHATLHNGNIHLSSYRKTPKRELFRIYAIRMQKQTHMESKVQQLVNFLYNVSSLFSTWCSHCGKLKKSESKKKRQEEQRKNREKFAKEQNEMLEKARLEMLQQTSFNPLLYQINALANQMAMNYLYCHSTDGSKVSFQDAVLVYKIIATPKELLLETMKGIEETELSSLYRKNALRLHPDKCEHPQAVQAFQKFVDCYKLIKSVPK